MLRGALNADLYMSEAVSSIRAYLNNLMSGFNAQSRTRGISPAGHEEIKNFVLLELPYFLETIPVPTFSKLLLPSSDPSIGFIAVSPMDQNGTNVLTTKNAPESLLRWPR